MLKPYNNPPPMKVYEALGTLADGRIRVKGNEAEVDSSQKTKTYRVMYDPTLNTIVASDSGTFWQRYVSYPSIALLLEKGIIKYDKALANELKGIIWKDMADKYKHDYEKMEGDTLSQVKHPKELQAENHRILQEVISLKLLQPEHLLRPTK